MSTREKTLQTWKNNTPIDAPIDSVMSVIEHYFGKQVQNGSHIMIKDERLQGWDGSDIAGVLTVCVAGGQKVKGYNLKNLASAIEYVRGEEI